MPLKQSSINKMIKSQYDAKHRAFLRFRNKQIKKYFGDNENMFTVEKKMTFQEAVVRLKFKSDENDISVPNINIVNYGNPQGLKHYIAKAALVYTLINKKVHCSTEVMDCDVYFIERDIAIEIEKDYHPKKIQEKIKKFSKRFNDVFIFDLEEIPDSIHEMQQFFIKKLAL